MNCHRCVIATFQPIPVVKPIDTLPLPSESQPLELSGRFPERRSNKPACGNAVGDGVPVQLLHRPRFHGIRGQITVLGIPLQSSLPFQETANTAGDRLGQTQVQRASAPSPTRTGGSIGTIGIHPVEEQHVEMDIQVERGPNVFGSG